MRAPRAARPDEGNGGRLMDGGREPLRRDLSTVHVLEQGNALAADELAIGVDPFQDLGRGFADLLAGEHQPVL